VPLSVAIRLRTEHEEQTLLFKWRDETMLMQSDVRLRLALRWTHAIPNGYHKSINMRMKAKREGVTAGILDVFVPSPEFGRRIGAEYHGLYIEMKRTGNKPSDLQKEFMEYLDLVKYKHVVCYFWQHAAREIVQFLGLTSYAEIGEPEWLQAKSDLKKAA
jgi:hypothetical protein